MMIHLIEFKKLNYVNEKIGFTLSYQALQEINKYYTKYINNKIAAPKNVASWDFHCGHQKINTNKKNKIIVIDKIIFSKRSQCIKTKTNINDMELEDLYNFNLTHRCDGFKQKDNILSLPNCKQCGIRKQYVDNRLIINEEVVFDRTQHPTNTNTQNLLNECGFVFCFKIPFELFVANLAKIYNINLSVVEDWRVYKSSINPLWKQKAMLTIKRGIKRISKHNDNIHPLPMLIDSDDMDDDKQNDQEQTNMDNDNKQDEKEPNNMNNDIESTSIVIPPVPALGKVKTESVIVDCFRKELIPFIECNLTDNNTKSEIQKICNKYFYRLDQFEYHKRALIKMRDNDNLSYYDEIVLPKHFSYDKIINTNIDSAITADDIVKDWMCSHKENPLEPPFTGTELSKFIKNDFVEDTDDNIPSTPIQHICVSTVLNNDSAINIMQIADMSVD